MIHVIIDARADDHGTLTYIICAGKDNVCQLVKPGERLEVDLLPTEWLEVYPLERTEG